MSLDIFFWKLLFLGVSLNLMSLTSFSILSSNSFNSSMNGGDLVDLNPNSFGATWGKTESEDLFDVTMGSWDGAETCEIVGSYMLSLIREKHGDNVALYCDDGLGAFNATPQEVEKTKKCLCKIFRDNGLKITVEATLGKVNFLDVTLDLLKSSFAHYTKPNNTTVYAHAQSNHPPSIIKNIPPPPPPPLDKQAIVGALEQ